MRESLMAVVKKARGRGRNQRTVKGMKNGYSHDYPSVSGNGHTLRIAGITAGSVFALVGVVMAIGRWSGAMEGEDKVTTLRVQQLQEQVERLDKNIMALTNEVYTLKYLIGVSAMQPGTKQGLPAR